MGQRRRARECALQMLFQIDLVGSPPEDAFEHFWQDQEAAEDTRSFAEELVRGVHRERRALDAVVTGSTEHWRIGRMAVVDRNVLRMAIYEMIYEAGVPPVVVIDEAIEVAKKFGGEESGAFVNGVLDAIRRRIEKGEIPIRKRESDAPS